MNNYFWPGVLTFIISISSFAQDKGQFQLYEELLNENIKTYNEKQIEIKNNQLTPDDLKNLDSIHINSLYLSSVIFSSPSRYVILGQKDKCSLYDLLSTSLLQEPGKAHIENVIVDIPQDDKSIKSVILTKENFLNQIAYKQCPGSQKLAEYFKVTNLRTTYSKLKFDVANSLDTCYLNHQKLLLDVKTPYICDDMEAVRTDSKNRQILKGLKEDNSYRNELQRDIAQASYIKKILKPNFIENFQSFCLNLENKNQFCANYFDKSFWDGIAEKKNPELLHYYCDRFFTNQSLNKAKTQICLNKLTEDNKECHYSKYYPSLEPAQSCDLLSTALNNNRLVDDYKDCPADIGNLAVTHISRLLLHYDPKVKKFKQCELNATYPLARFDQDFLEGSSWKVEVCFDDPIKKVEICRPTLLHDSKDDLSLTANIAKILERLKGFDPKTQSCKIISTEEYKPLLLEYQSSCYIIKETTHCLATDCKLKVILDQKEFTKFNFKSNLLLDLFPFQYSSENKAFSKVFKRVKYKNDKAITNISSLKNFFKAHPSSVVTGMGCQEDLLPSLSRERFFAQCTPMPFIVDGLIQENGHAAIIIRTALDHINAPRIIPWSYIFSSLKRYQLQHPLRLWGLYAFY